MSLKINIDAAALAKEFKEFAEEVERDIQKGMASLSTIAHAKIVELASAELQSTRETFLDNLSSPEQIAEGVWVISLNEKAFFVEEGLPAGFDMKPGLLKDAKTSSKGYKYKVVPLDHGQPPSQMTQSARDIVSTLRTELKKKKIPFKKIEYNSDGTPRLGKVHSLNLPSDIPGKGNTPALHRVSIYQSMKNGNVRRDIMTFRTVTNGPGSDGKWIHPGLEAKKIMDKAADWAEQVFYDQILPEILDKWK